VKYDIEIERKTEESESVKSIKDVFAYHFCHHQAYLYGIDNLLALLKSSSYHLFFTMIIAVVRN
jgi:hypothetical protein